MANDLELAAEYLLWLDREHYAGRVSNLPHGGSFALRALAQRLRCPVEQGYRTSARPSEVELVTIGQALVTSPPGADPRSVRRWVTAWAERGELRAEIRGKTWYVDPDQLQRKITERNRSR